MSTTPLPTVRCETCRHYRRGYCHSRQEQVDYDDACRAWQSSTPPSAAEQFQAMRKAIEETEPTKPR